MKRIINHIRQHSDLVNSVITDVSLDEQKKRYAKYLEGQDTDLLLAAKSQSLDKINSAAATSAQSWSCEMITVSCINKELDRRYGKTEADFKRMYQE